MCKKVSRVTENGTSETESELRTNRILDEIGNWKFGQQHRPFRLNLEMLVPFAPRWLGIKQPLDGQNNIRNMEGFYFELGWSPAWTESRRVFELHTS